MIIKLHTQLKAEDINYMSAKPLGDDIEVSQIALQLSEAQKRIGIIGVFEVVVPNVGKTSFSLRALEFGQDFRLDIVGWYQDKYPVSKEYYPEFKASLLKGLHLALIEDEVFLDTISVAKVAGTKAQTEYRQQKKAMAVVIHEIPAVPAEDAPIE